jgi:SNF2 family DNA or RNA helicase
MSNIESTLEVYEENCGIGKDKSPDQLIEVPRLKAPLFPHQKTSVYHMEYWEKNKKPYRQTFNNISVKSNIAILGDKPGYGKTRSVIALIANDKMEFSKKYVYKQYMEIGAEGSYVTFREETKKGFNCSLILASNSIIKNWEEELINTDLKFKILKTNKEINEVKPKNYDVLLVTDKMYNNLMDKYPDSEYAWKRFVFDEAASIYIPSMRSICAKFSWFVTATFPNIRAMIRGGRKCHYMKQVFWNMSPTLFYTLLVKNSDLYTTKSFTMPTNKIIIHKCATSKLITFISQIVNDQEVLALLSAGDIEGAKLKLNNGEIIEGDLIDIILDKKESKLSDAKFHLEKAEKAYEKHKNKTTEENLEKWRKTVEDLEKQINESKNKYEELINDDCFICCENKNSVIVGCCNNMFCEVCINKLKGKPCPMCRSNLSKVTKIKKAKKGVKKSNKKIVNKAKTKTENIEEILKNKGKFIIASNSENSLKNMANFLNTKNYVYTFIKGTATQRMKSIDSFRKENVNIILLNSANNGAGINLPETTDIILLHEMEPSIEKQLIGRAERIGRIKQLNIHKLIDVNEEYEIINNLKDFTMEKSDDEENEEKENKYNEEKEEKEDNEDNWNSDEE